MIKEGDNQREPLSFVSTRNTTPIFRMCAMRDRSPPNCHGLSRTSPQTEIVGTVHQKSLNDNNVVSIMTHPKSGTQDEKPGPVHIKRVQSSQRVTLVTLKGVCRNQETQRTKKNSANNTHKKTDINRGNKQ